MGSYVLVSHQSQTCSSYCTESCITTRTPWLGRGSVQSQSWREVRVQPPPAQPRYMPHLVRMCQEVANAPKGGIGENRSCCQESGECLGSKEGSRLGCSVYEGRVGGSG